MPETLKDLNKKVLSNRTEGYVFGRERRNEEGIGIRMSGSNRSWPVRVRCNFNQIGKKFFVFVGFTTKRRGYDQQSVEGKIASFFNYFVSH